MDQPKMFVVSEYRSSISSGHGSDPDIVGRKWSTGLANQFYQKCLFAKAQPDPDFKYCSNADARWLSSKRIAVTTRHGWYSEV